MLGSLLFIIVAGSAPAGMLDFREEIEVRSSHLTLGAVTDVSQLPQPLRDRATALKLFALPSTRQDLVIDHARITSRVRALMPALSAWLPKTDAGVIRITRFNSTLRDASGQCGEGLSPGEAVAVSVDGGWFRVEREVTALQEAKPGHGFFARTADGQVLRASCKGNE